MGWSEAFAWADPADVFREHAALSAFENDGARIFNLGGLADISDAAYDDLPPMQWPVPKPGQGVTGPRLFARGGFSTPDGKARMVPLTIRAEDDVDGSLLTLNTGRIRDQWHTMTRTGRVPHLMTHVAAPSLAMHPREAALRGISHGSLARIESDDGSVVMRVTLDEGVRPGDVFAPMHWTDQFTSSGPIDRLVHAKTDPVSGQPDLKGTRVRVSGIVECWRGPSVPHERRRTGTQRGPVVVQGADQRAGLLSSWRAGMSCNGRFIPRVCCGGCSGYPPMPSWFPIPIPARRCSAMLAFCNGRLASCVFFGPAMADFSRRLDQAKALLGKDISPVDRIALSGRTPAAANGEQANGKIVCSCFSVSEGDSCRHPSRWPDHSGADRRPAQGRYQLRLLHSRIEESCCNLSPH